MLFSVGALVIILKKRFKEHFVYLLLIFMALINIIDVCGAGVELAKIEDEVERIRSLEKWLYLLMTNYFTAALFISPSLSFLVFGYGPPSVIANIFLMVRYGEFKNSDFLNKPKPPLKRRRQPKRGTGRRSQKKQVVVFTNG